MKEAPHPFLSFLLTPSSPPLYLSPQEESNEHIFSWHWSLRSSAIHSFIHLCVLYLHVVFRQFLQMDHPYPPQTIRVLLHIQTLKTVFVQNRGRLHTSKASSSIVYNESFVYRVQSLLSIKISIYLGFFRSSKDCPIKSYKFWI